MAAAADDGDWQGVENDVTDPEELRVIHAALDSFFQYSRVAHFNSTHLRRQSFYALPQAHWRLLAAPPFSFLETLDRVDEAIDSNAELGRAIATAGIRSFHMQPSANAATDAGIAAAAATTTVSVLPIVSGPWTGAAKPSDMDKARSTLRQFYRDWSAEGARERDASYGPVKRFLEEERCRVSRRPSSPAGAAPARGGGNNVPIAPAIPDAPDSPAPPLKVLVPGAGLGRLVFDLCDLGYEVEGNEISYHQLLASAYILNRAPRAGCHRIYPWIQTFSNHRSRANQLRSYAVPDVHPAARLGAPARAGGSMSMAAADFLCLYEQDDQLGRFDAVATVFFLDTAPNLVRYLSCIRGCLRPGGVLVNVGPLLWHFENSAPGNRGRDDDGDGEHDPAASTGIADPGSFELTEDEVLALVETVGFEIVRRDDDADLEAPYIQDPDSMLRTVYRPSSWVARKRADWRGDV